MLEIKAKSLPFEIDAEDLGRMRPQDKKRSYQAILLQLLRKNPNGITAPKLEELSGFDRRTLIKHLDYLVAIREAYSVDMGANLVLYYPNGRVMHPSADIDHQIGDKFYRFSFIENPLGKFLYIQEKTKDEYNTFMVKGGLVIQLEHVHAFMEKLSETYAEVKRSEPT